MAQEWWSNDKTVGSSASVSTGVVIPAAPEKPGKPEKPTETFRIATAAEKTAAGLDPARSYQVNNVTGEFKDVGGQPTAKPAVVDPNRAFKINSTLDQLENLRKIAQRTLSVGETAGRVRQTPVIGALLGQNRADLEGALSQVEGSLIQDQLAVLAQLNPQGVSSLANSETEARRLASSIANLDPNQSYDQFLQGISRAEEYYKRQLEQSGGARAAATAPEAGARGVPALEVAQGDRIATDRDIEIASLLQGAWQSGKSIEEVNALAIQLGTEPLPPETIEALRSDPNRQIRWTPNRSGVREGSDSQMGTGSAIAAGAVRGFTGNLAEEALSLVSPEAAAKLQAAGEAAQQQAPLATMAGEVIGGALSPLSRIGPAGTITGEAVRGGIYGGLYGGGEAAPDAGIMERVLPAVVGLTTGAGTGALAQRFLGGGGEVIPTPDGGVVPPVMGITPEVPTATTPSVAPTEAIDILSLPDDEFVTLYHGTTKEAAEKIKQTGTLKSAGEPSVYLTTDRTGGGYGDGTVVPVRVRRGLLEIDDEFPDGRVDFRIDLNRPGGSVPVQVLSGAGMAPLSGMTSPIAGEAVEDVTAQIGSEEMINLAQKAISRGPGASKARAQLAEMAKTNPEAKAAADRLGLELPVDVLSDNSQLKEVIGLTRAQIGSEAKQAWNETVQAASDRAHAAMDELNAVTDISQVSADVFNRLDNAQSSLGRQASDLRQEVTNAVDVRGRVDATGIKSWLQTRIDDLGGGKEGIAALSPEEKRLWGIVSKGQPTYAMLNEQRDLIGQALEKGTGPWSNTNMKRLKDIYGSLAGDQINFIEASAGKEIADKQRAANTLFKQMYDGREQMERIFTKDLSGSLAPLMQRAITQGTKGNVQTLKTLVNIIPEDMRGKVLTSALFKAAKATDETFSFTNFANIYRDLRANGEVYKELAKAVGPEGDKLLTDLYAVSRRLSDADKAISRTGASTQLNLLNSERLLSRILMASGGAAGAGLIGSVLGGPGAAIIGAGLAAAAPEIAQRVGKTNAQKLHNLISSEPFRDLTVSAATGDALDRNINRVAGSKQFRDYAKMAGIDMKDARNWLNSAISKGATIAATEATGPEAKLAPPTVEMPQ